MVLTDEMKNEFNVDRAEEGVNNGTVEYKEIDRYTRIADIGYDFAHIACENHDPESRACAFDAYLVTDGPIEIKHQGSFDTDHDFVYHDGKYYRRIDRYHDANDSITYNVERIRARELLAGMARNISTEHSEVNRGIFSHWHHRLLVTGEAKTSYVSPTADESWRVRARENIGIDAFDPVHENIIGNVYRYNETYYTVIVSEDTIDRPGISPWSRLLLALTGPSIWIYRL